MVSFNSKHNLANHEDNRDGANQNYSNNFGHEGLDAPSATISLRDQIRRMLIATLAVSPGVPMVLGGDELSRTQYGNNNAYCQDRADYTFDWKRIDTDYLSFFAKVFSLRRKLISPSFEVDIISDSCFARDDGVSCANVVAFDYTSDESKKVFRTFINFGYEECKVGLKSNYETFRAHLVLDSSIALVDSSIQDEFTETEILIPGKTVMAVLLVG